MRSRIGYLISRTVPILPGLVAAVVLASTATLLATTTTVNGISVTIPTYPTTAPLLHCEPQNDPSADRIFISGMTAGSTVRLNYTFSNGISGGPMSSLTQTFNNQGPSEEYPIPYPEDTSTWPGQDGDTRFIVINLAVQVTNSSGTSVKIPAGRWKVVCVPDKPEGDFKGCTPGYWRQDQHFPSWVGYAPGNFFDTVFGVDSSLNPPGPNTPEFSNPTLLDAVWIGGGGENAMARHAVAALLNASNSAVNYPLSVGQVIAAVQNAYATGDFDTAHNLFEGYNEIGCPLN